MTHPAVAFVVPVYNTDPDVFRRTLDSLLQVDYSNFYIVIVDESSNEGTRSAIRGFSKCEKVLIFQQKSTGVSGARNEGVFHARHLGVDYVAFVDADDLIEPNFLLEMVSVALETNCDVVCGGTDIFVSYHDTQTTNPGPYKRILLTRENAALAYCKTRISPLVMGKLYKTKLFDSISFSECLQYGEDTNFLLRLFLLAESAALTSYCGYHLNRVPNIDSLCRTESFSNTHALHLLRANIDLLDADYSMLSPRQKEFIAKQYRHVVADAFLEMYPRFTKRQATRQQIVEFQDLKRRFDQSKAIGSYSPYNMASSIKKRVYGISPFIYRLLSRVYLKFHARRYGLATTK